MYRHGGHSRTYHNKSSHHGGHAMGKVRFVHNVAGGPKVNISVDGNEVLSDIPYKAVSPYLKVPVGDRNIKVIATVSGAVLQNLIVGVNNGKYTAIVHGSLNESQNHPINTVILTDDSTCPQGNNSHVRFVHADGDAPAVDVLVDGQVAFRNVQYGETGNPEYAPVPAGLHRLSVNLAGTNTEVLGLDDVPLEAGQIYSIFATGIPGSDKYPLGALLETDSSSMCMMHHHWKY